MADHAVPDLDTAFGYYMAAPTRIDKPYVHFHVYDGSAQTCRLALIEIL